MLTKLVEAQIKAGSTEGEFEALLTPYELIDTQGDRIKRGAFTKSIERWIDSGRKIPVILSHQHNDPFATIGEADPREFIDTPRGLFGKAVLDMENPVATQAYKLMKKGLLKDVSIGFTTSQTGIKRASDGALDIVEGELIEFGPTLKAAAPGAQILSIKSALDALEAEREDAPSAEEIWKVVQELEVLVKDISGTAREAVEELTDEEPAEVKSEGQDWLSVYQREIELREL